MLNNSSQTGYLSSSYCLTNIIFICIGSIGLRKLKSCFFLTLFDKKLKQGDGQKGFLLEFFLHNDSSPRASFQQAESIQKEHQRNGAINTPSLEKTYAGSSNFCITSLLTPVKENPPSWKRFCMVTMRVRSENSVMQ